MKSIKDIFTKAKPEEKPANAVGAVICEYNPFHNGHKYHIEETRRLHGVSHMVAVMSGNFTQRGDVALIDKWARAKTALENGIDLVIELPVAYSLGSAEDFAAGAVSIINKLGCVDYLSFGSECGDIELLKETAGAVHYASEHEEFLALMRSGNAYPVALQKIIEKYYDEEIVKTLTTPNNTLGIEYLKALNESGSFVKPVTILRHGAAHDDMRANNPNIISASLLRSKIMNKEDCSAYMPAVEAEDYATLARLETAILSRLRMMSPAEICKAPNVRQGLENRIYKAARRAGSLAELMLLIKTKRYTMARLRRIVLCCYLGVTKADIKAPMQYIRILGMNARGRELLGRMDCPLPVDTSLRTLADSGHGARQQAMLEERAGNQYALAFQKIQPCGVEFTRRPVILE